MLGCAYDEMMMCGSRFETCMGVKTCARHKSASSIFHVHTYLIYKF